MEIYLVRHGEKEKGEDLCLTPNGIKQANALAERLVNKHFDLVYSSDMIRSKETAKAVIRRLDNESLSDESLNEFRLSMLKKDKEDWTTEESKRYEGLIAFMDKLIEKRNEDISVLIIAHGVTNRIIMSYLIDIPMKNIVRFEQSETGISSLYWSKSFENWRVRYWNDSTHLD